MKLYFGKKAWLSVNSVVLRRGKPNEESTFELDLHSKLYIPKMEHNFSLVFSSSIPNAYLYDIT